MCPSGCWMTRVVCWHIKQNGPLCLCVVLESHPAPNDIYLRVFFGVDTLLDGFKGKRFKGKPKEETLFGGSESPPIPFSFPWPNTFCRRPRLTDTV